MLNKVTFTGIDKFTDIDRLVELTKMYPFVEYGCLVSQSNTNNNILNKYPSLYILDNLLNKNINLSLHICGKWAREIVQLGKIDELSHFIEPYHLLFNRIQLNVSSLSSWNKSIQLSELLWNKEIIIQTNTKNFDLYNDFKSQKNVYGFQDNSGGEGKVETEWYLNDENYFGYAGGIGLFNVLDIVKYLNSIRIKPYWIDMETRIRTNDKFDLNICENICKILVDSHLVERESNNE